MNQELTRPRFGILHLGLVVIGVALVVRIVDHSTIQRTRYPVCRPSNKPKGGLPTLLFLAGVEGGGHELFENFLKHIPLNITIERFSPDLHLTNDPKQQLQGSCPALPYARQSYDFGGLISKQIETVKPLGIYARARDPFPMGRIRTALARPDLVTLANFDGLLYNLKVIVMIRDFSRAILWSVSKGFHADDVGLQCRMVEDNLVYLDASIRALPCSSYIAVDVETAAERPKDVAPGLAKFLDLPGVGVPTVQAALEIAASEWQPPAASTLPKFHGESVDVFMEQRKQLWPLLNGLEGARSFVPTHPNDWPSPTSRSS